MKPDWLLVYLIEDDILTLTLIDTGSHADIFRIKKDRLKGQSFYCRLIYPSRLFFCG